MKLSDELRASIGPVVANALSEDIGGGDLTASLVDADAIVGATILAQRVIDTLRAPLGRRGVRDNLTMHCGGIDWYVGDGQTAEADDVICKLVGPARTLLSR